jgi:hypothetical protein
MATILDVTLFDFFSPVLLFLLVYATVYAILEKLKFFGDNRGIHAILSFSVSLLFLFSGAARSVLEFALPWYLILGFIALNIIMIMGLFGAEEGDLKSALTADSRIITWTIVLSVVILIFALSHAIGQSALDTTQDNQTIIENADDSTATGSFNKNLYRTLFHPKVLGMLALLLIAMFTILFLTAGPKR